MGGWGRLSTPCLRGGGGGGAGSYKRTGEAVAMVTGSESYPRRRQDAPTAPARPPGSERLDAPAF